MVAVVVVVDWWLWTGGMATRAAALTDAATKSAARQGVGNKEKKEPHTVSLTSAARWLDVRLCRGLCDE